MMKSSFKDWIKLVYSGNYTSSDEGENCFLYAPARKGNFASASIWLPYTVIGFLSNNFLYRLIDSSPYYLIVIFFREV